MFIQPVPLNMVIDGYELCRYSGGEPYRRMKKRRGFPRRLDR
jgi:hypothetical protein